ncbi:hypothetical protein GCM10018793_12550 [Streptomyces sulfonofaciens]|uniref:VOC domain-containing protein n=1 Tax=Streptomyces sulfonofaciens TaxID=68272 RepID=A0A919FXJ5_9ACTN|nr:VOC family protein [Streptomyces sulfonofaciens]GHH73621.1 hypothetical protein GCM10018793_12550 [Streptomyces sulfonofaciens]
MTDTRTGKGVRASVCPTLLYTDARAAIQELTEGLGFTEVNVYEDGGGTVMHAELAQGNGAVMLGTRGRGGTYDQTMQAAGPAGVYVAVEDVDAHHRRAEEHGVEILMPPTEREYGSREYRARDLEGNVWSFGTYSPALS